MVQQALSLGGRVRAQAQLETVIPSPGGAVLVLAGPHKGLRGTLLSINTDKFQAQARAHALACAQPDAARL